jgi:hypothetical protein
MDLLSRTSRSCTLAQAYWHCAPEAVANEAARREEAVRTSLQTAVSKKRVDPHPQAASTGESEANKGKKARQDMGVRNQVARELWAQVEKDGMDTELIARVKHYQQHGSEDGGERSTRSLPTPADYQRYTSSLWDASF